jgi:hypothetical protein
LEIFEEGLVRHVRLVSLIRGRFGNGVGYNRGLYDSKGAVGCRRCEVSASLGWELVALGSAQARVPVPLVGARGVLGWVTRAAPASERRGRLRAAPTEVQFNLR